MARPSHDEMTHDTAGDPRENLPPPDQEMQALLHFLSQQQASDLHLKSGFAPIVRIGGHLRRIQGPPLPENDYIEQMLMPMVPPGERG